MVTSILYISLSPPSRISMVNFALVSPIANMNQYN